jgi:hypothetical protein
MPKLRLIKLYLLSLSAVIVVMLLLEYTARNMGDAGISTDESVADLMREMPHMRLSGREIGNQMLVHNVALFSQYPSPESITSAYVGTSRSKVLRPTRFGIPDAIVGAGNSYNEITYGLLLQAEILRLRFPHLKRVYVETSMLMRRPDRLILEEDHKKYLPLLKSLAPLCRSLPVTAGCHHVFADVERLSPSHMPMRSVLLQKGTELKLANLVMPKKQAGMLPMEDPELSRLMANGERKGLPRAMMPKEDQLPEITNDHIKVQRIRSTRSYIPGDGLFELIALWGREHGVEVVFFQPPVRSDLYRFQVEHGLADHVEDLERISYQYNIPFIDLDRPGLGFIDDWTLFSDEDHLETCLGSGLLTFALQRAMQAYREQHVLSPVIERSILQRQSGKLKICDGQ